MGGAADVRRPAPCGPHCGTTYGYRHHGCRCLATYDAINEWSRARAAAIRKGTWQPMVDAGPCRATLQKLGHLGMTLDMISAQTFLHRNHLSRICRRVTRMVRPATAELILTTEFAISGDRPDSLVPAVGSVRRLQGLRLAGWPPRVIEDLIDAPGFEVDKVAHRKSVTWRRHTAVVDLCAVLQGRDPVAWGVPSGEVTRSVAWAMARGWVPLGAWVQDIDDPRSEPYKAVVRRRARQAPAGSRRLAIVEETAHLAAYGAGPEDIAERLGIEWASVLVAHARAGVPVPGRLVA